MPLDIDTPLTPKGDQPKAIAQLIEGIKRGHKHLCLPLYERYPFSIDISEPSIIFW